MYQPASFEETRPEVLHALVQAHPLAQLVTLTDDGLEANPIPMLFEPGDTPDAPGWLRGHIARANPLWRSTRADVEALAIFQGPQAYVSPNHYPSKQEHGKVVPTWNYAVVQARGELRFIHEAGWIHALLERLTDRNEATQPKPWKVDDAPPDHTQALLRAIVGIEMRVTRWQGKWKMSQNRSASDRDGVIRGLSAEGGAALEVADAVRHAARASAAGD